MREIYAQYLTILWIMDKTAQVQASVGCERQVRLKTLHIMMELRGKKACVGVRLRIRMGVGVD